jgi:hypothetical protein
MCLHNYPECGDGGDGCCHWHLSISLAFAQRAATSLFDWIFRGLVWLMMPTHAIDNHFRVERRV